MQNLPSCRPQHGNSHSIYTPSSKSSKMYQNQNASQHSGELAHEPELDVGDEEEYDVHNYQGHVVLP